MYWLKPHNAKDVGQRANFFFNCMFFCLFVVVFFRLEKWPFLKIPVQPHLNNRCSLRIQDFPEGDEPTFYLVKSMPKLHKNERNWTETGEYFPSCPLNPSINIMNTHGYKPVVLLHQHSQLLLVLRTREQREVREIFRKSAIIMSVDVNLK